MSSDLFLSIPTVILSFFSIFSCLYVMLSITESGSSPFQNIRSCRLCCACCKQCCIVQNYQKSSKLQSQTQAHKLSMEHIIFFMCFTDLCQSMQVIFNWIPLAFLMPFWSEPSCKIIGIYAQFFTIQSPLWHCMLAFNLGYLMINGSVEAINNLIKQRYYQYLIIIIIPIFSCIIPIIVNGINVYGIYINNNSNDKECWLKIEDWQLVFVIAILLSLSFHYIVLGLLCFKCHQNVAATHRYISVIQRLSRFVVFYTIIRFLPAMERIWECTTAKSPPFWLILSHHISIASVGFVNGIVWSINQRDKQSSELRRNPLLQQGSINNTSSITTDTTTIDLNQMRQKKNIILHCH